ncbi:MAG: YggT family protein [Defluviitaleaceae bacterium]|nr:YggT family protein [Defluviitaleaceae bacterium]
MLIEALNWFFYILHVLIFVRVILSWVRIGRNSPFGAIVFALTEPILSPIRHALSKSPLGGPGMMLDFSPIIALLLLQAAQMVVLSFF